jgi:hypothetical protein
MASLASDGDASAPLRTTTGLSSALANAPFASVNLDDLCHVGERQATTSKEDQLGHNDVLANAINSCVSPFDFAHLCDTRCRCRL